MKLLQGLPERDANSRKRRAHKKSRAGCGNCKLRRVKCDEGQFECEKCLSFGVCCNYDNKIPCLQPRYAMTQRLEGKVQTYKALTAGVYSTSKSTIELTGVDLSRLERFQLRTLITITPIGVSQVYNFEIFQLIFKHEFLMHIAQTLTAIHDRYLSPEPGRRTIEEIYHWTKGTSLFNKILSNPIHPSDRDAIWGAANVLGIITFASIEGSSPERAWPLHSPISTEPEWLKMGRGKTVLWDIVNPERPDSIFHALVQLATPTASVLDNVPPAFIKLFELDRISPDCNPYFSPAICISSTLGIDCTNFSGAVFHSFSGHIRDEFGRLVMKNDARALLLMAYWYSKISKGLWWLRRRALMEGQATCLYLEQHFAQEREIQDLLEEPRRLLFRYEDGDSDGDIFGL